MENCTSSGGGGSGSNPSVKAYKATQEEVTGLPSLQGSEKQVKWANDIRQEAFNTFDTLSDKMSRGIDGQNRQMYYPESGDDITIPMDSINATKKALSKYLSGETSAENIIKIRGAIDYDSISKLVDGVTLAKKKAKASGKVSALTDDMIYKFVKMRIDSHKLGTG